MMIEAVVFAMDGVLIDSEPLWQESEIDAFARVGLRLTREMCMQTMGLRVDEVVDYWRRRHAWEGMTLADMEGAIIRGVEERILSNGSAMKGVERALEFFRARGTKVA